MAVSYPAPVVLSFGDEPFFLDRDAQGLARDPDRFVIKTDGSEFKGDYELVSLFETNSAESSLRLILVDNAQKVKPEKALKGLVESLDPSNKTTVLVLIFRTEKLPAFWAKASDKVVVKREHRKLKTFDSNNEVLGFISTEARRMKLRLGDGVANLMFRFTGNDLHKIANELSKLQLLVGSEQVTVEHLQSILTISSGATTWDVVDAAANKDLKGALNSLASLYKYSPDDPAIPLAYALMAQTEKMLVACTLMEKKASEEEVASRIAMHPYRCRTYFLPLARKHTTRSLSAYMQQLCSLDVEIKRAAGPSRRTLVELAVMSLAGC